MSVAFSLSMYVKRSTDKQGMTSAHLQLDGNLQSKRRLMRTISDNLGKKQEDMKQMLLFKQLVNRRLGIAKEVRIHHWSLEIIMS